MNPQVEETMVSKNGALSKRPINNNKFIELSYILGISLLLAAVIYFFAANWPGFQREVKIALSISLIVLFYGLSAMLSSLLRQRPLISQLFLLAGCVAFGVGVGLLGQIYNSHADSYMLFLVWLVPAFLFSFITKFQPFYVLSYVLFHLSIWFYLFPSSLFYHYSEGGMVLSFFCIALLNVGIFLFAKWKLQSKSLVYMSFILFHFIMINLSVTLFFERYGLLFNFLYIPVLVGLYIYFSKYKVEKGLLFLTGLATFGYVLIKYIDLAIRYFSEGFYLFILLFVVGIVAGNVYLVRWLKRLGNKEGQPENREVEQENHEVVQQNNQRNQRGHLWSKFFVGLTTAVASVLGTLAFIGLIILINGGFPGYFFLLVAVFAFLLPMTFFKEIDSTIRYTLLCVGYLLAHIAVWDVHFLAHLLLIAVVAITWFFLKSSMIRFIAYGFFNLSIYLFFTFHYLYILEDSEIALVTLTVMNGIFFVVPRFVRHRLAQESLERSSLLFGLFSFFLLTFVQSQVFGMYYVYNLLFFVIVTFSVFQYSRWQKKVEFRLVLAFWFVFLAYKYYDLVWKLLHKSIAFAIIGLLFLLLAFWLERRMNRPSEGKISVFQKKWIPIMLVICLQLTIIGVQIAKSEYVLAHGESIKLELQPIDPRSLIQGDYVTLGYTIANTDIDLELAPREKIQLLLTPDEQGVYVYKGIYKHNGLYSQEYVPEEEDVVINARYDGWSGFVFGIESYFVPEGTGREVERSAKYAYVQVSRNGDAILVGLAEE